MLCPEQPEYLKWTRTGRHIEVRTPTVEISCDFPLACALAGHGAYIDFQRLPISCSLSPYDILHSVCVGRDTMISEHTRPYLHQYDDKRWMARLGRTSVRLYLDEVRDLCACLDAIGRAYTDTLWEGTTHLEAWNYIQALIPGKAAGVRLLMVPLPLWRAMLRFAQARHQVGRGETCWHCESSPQEDAAITVNGPDGSVHATIWAIPEASADQGDFIQLLYEYPDHILIAQLADSSPAWYSHLGPSSVWTAEYTREWLLTVLIPEVRAQYPADRAVGVAQPCNLRYRIAEKLAPDVFRLYRNRFAAPPVVLSLKQMRAVQLTEATCASHFISYIEDIRFWLAHYPADRLPSAPLRAYYAAIADLAASASPHICVVRAIADGLDQACERSERRHDVPRGSTILTPSFEEFTASLREQARRVSTVKYEDAGVAALLSEVFLHILMHGYAQPEQARLFRIQQALLPLWEQARFDCRFSIPQSF